MQHLTPAKGSRSTSMPGEDELFQEVESEALVLKNHEVIIFRHHSREYPKLAYIRRATEESSRCSRTIFNMAMKPIGIE